MEKTLFKTSDFNLVATLHSLNYKFERNERGANGKVVFFFKQDVNLEVVVEKYQQGKLCIMLG